MDQLHRDKLQNIAKAYESGDLTPLEEHFLDTAYDVIDRQNDVGNPLYLSLLVGLVAFSIFGLLPAIAVVLIGCEQAWQRFRRRDALLAKLDAGDYIQLLPDRECQWYRQVYGEEGYQQAIVGNYSHKRIIGENDQNKIVKTNQETPKESPVVDVKGETVPSQPVVPVVDLAGRLATDLHPLIITAKPRVGKGLIVSEMARRAKQFHPELSRWLIQPKPHPSESGYWQDYDRYWGRMLEDYPINDESIAKELTEFIMQWRAQPHRPTLLVIDEQVKLAAILPKWYKSWFLPQMKVEASSGETDGRFIVLLTQSPLVEDVGVSSGDRGCFDFLTLQKADTLDHAEVVRKSMASVKTVPTAEQFASVPSGILFFHSRSNEWAGVPRIQPPKPVAMATEWQDFSTDILPVAEVSEDGLLQKLLEWFTTTGLGHSENGRYHINTIRSYFKPDRKFLRSERLRQLLIAIEDMQLGEFDDETMKLFHFWGA